MGRYVSWLANAALLVLCCVLIASTTNAVFAAWLAPEPAALAPDGNAAAATIRQSSWNDRQVILARNLFNASLLAPAALPAEVEEDLEETKLPLALLGTFASPDPEIARAAVDDQEARQHVVLRVGDEIQNGRAKLIRIERRRIVLSEGGTLRELTFSDSLAESPKPAKRRVAARKNRRSSAAARRRAAKPTLPDPADVQEAMSSPANLFSQARILPKWEDGRMVGVQVSGIKPGSVFEEMGISNGEVITQLNGIDIDSPEASAEVMLEFTEAQELNVTVKGSDGPRNVVVPVNR